MTANEIQSAFYALQRNRDLNFPEPDREAGKLLADMLADFVNASTGVAERAFTDELMRQHRTLQQSVFSLIMLCIERWAKAYEDRCYDARNEYTCQMSQKIMELLDGVKRAPLI